MPNPPSLRLASIHPVLRHKRNLKLQPAPLPNARPHKINIPNGNRTLERAGAALEHALHAIRRQSRAPENAHPIPFRHGRSPMHRSHTRAVHRFQRPQRQPTCPARCHRHVLRLLVLLHGSRHDLLDLPVRGLPHAYPCARLVDGDRCELEC